MCITSSRVLTIELVIVLWSSRPLVEQLQRFETTPKSWSKRETRVLLFCCTLRVQLSLHIYNVWQGLYSYTVRPFVWSGTVSCWLSVTVLWSSVLRWRIPQSDSYFDWFTILVDVGHTWLHSCSGPSPNRRHDKWPRAFRAAHKDPRQVPGWEMEWYFTKRPHSCVLAWSGPPARWEMTDLSLFSERVANDGCLFRLERELMSTYVYQHWSVTDSQL